MACRGPRTSRGRAGNRLGARASTDSSGGCGRGPRSGGARRNLGASWWARRPDATAAGAPDASGPGRVRAEPPREHSARIAGVKASGVILPARRAQAACRGRQADGHVATRKARRQRSGPGGNRFRPMPQHAVCCLVSTGRPSTQACCVSAQSMPTRAAYPASCVRSWSPSRSPAGHGNRRAGCLRRPYRQVRRATAAAYALAKYRPSRGSKGLTESS
jgi:hypothetical protein